MNKLFKLFFLIVAATACPALVASEKNAEKKSTAIKRSFSQMKGQEEQLTQPLDEPEVLPSFDQAEKSDQGPDVMPYDASKKAKLIAARHVSITLLGRQYQLPIAKDQNEKDQTVKAQKLEQLSRFSLELNRLIASYVPYQWRNYGTLNFDHPIAAYAVSPDGLKLAVVHIDNNIQIISLVGKDAQQENTLAGHMLPPRHLVFSGDGKKLVSSDCKGDIKIWDSASGLCEKTCSDVAVATLHGDVHMISASSDTTKVSVLYKDGFRIIWDTTKDLPKDAKIVEGNDAAPHNRYLVALSPDGSYELSVLAGSLVLMLQRVHPFSKLMGSAGELLNPRGSITSIGFSRDNKTFCYADCKGIITQVGIDGYTKAQMADDKQSYRRVFNAPHANSRACLIDGQPFGIMPNSDGKSSTLHDLLFDDQSTMPCLVGNDTDFQATSAAMAIKTGAASIVIFKRNRPDDYLIAMREIGLL